MISSNCQKLFCVILIWSLSTAQHTISENSTQRKCTGPFDNIDCVCPEAMFACACRKESNCTWGSGCIPMAWKFDKFNQCGDWSDELPTKKPGDFYCDCANTTTGCISGYPTFYKESDRCDQRPSCSDWSDEKNCPNPCLKNQTMCACYGKVNDGCTTPCVPNNSVNDGKDDCFDRSDEPAGSCPEKYFKCDCLGQRNCEGCVPDKKVCDGYNDCRDWSDERNCSCGEGYFECDCYSTLNCTKSPGCLPWGFLFKCSGKSECGDWSDERNCTCKANKFACNCYKQPGGCGSIKGCIDMKRRCDGSQDCPQAEDEMNCTCAKFQCGCYSNKCPLSGCINHEKVCNGVNDCGDWTDELNCTQLESLHHSCKATPAWCGNEVTVFNCDQSQSYYNVTGKGILISTLYNYRCSPDEEVCVSGKRYITGMGKQRKELFQCQDGNFIDNKYFCDDNSAVGSSCNDDSDERCERFGFRCSGTTRKSVCSLPQANLYDSLPNCADRSDLCFVEGEFRCFQCLDRRLMISPSQVCDGIADCYDLSDECFCKNMTICNEIRGSCPTGQIRCNASCVNMTEALCNPKVDCTGYNTKYCSCSKTADKFMQCLTWNGFEMVRKCDGNPECKLFEDECSDCPNPPAFCQTSCVRSIKTLWQRSKIDTKVRFCNGVVEKTFGIDGISPQCALQGEQYCNASRFYCIHNINNVNIALSRVCDGFVDCDDESDEATTLCKGKWMECANRKQNISSGLVCDGVFDCNDGSDEAVQLCRSTRFKCFSGNVYSIDIKFVENGITNCQDGSDECLTTFSNRYEMIASLVFRAFFWIMGMLAIIGNSAVFLTTAKILYQANSMNTITKCNNMFILNLSVADFLMGVYLLSVVSVGVSFKGSYCIHDRVWRTSWSCSSLGALAITSCEASAFVMTAMTTFRLSTVHNPMLGRQIEFKTVAILTTFLAWGFAVIIAVLPLIKFKIEYFQTTVWFSNYFFGSQDINVETMLQLASNISNKVVLRWSEAKHIVSDAFPISIRGEFGYYGETSVCLPRLFATSDERGWEYSALIITINFLMFFYIFAVYCYIYKASNRMKNSKSSNTSTRLQRRIFRLIATDFCCWIPVCIMGYLSLAGVKMPTEAYVASACILLPINSALNPILYSNIIADRFDETKRYISRKTSDKFVTSGSGSSKRNATSKRNSDMLLEEIENPPANNT